MLMRNFKYWPEIVSFLTGITAGYVLKNLEEQGNLSWLAAMIGMAFVAALFSACFYRLAKKPGMYRHFPIYIQAFLTMFLFEMPELLLYIIAFPMTFYLLSLGFWEMPAFTILFLLCILMPILPICVIYRIKYKKRFAETTDQESVEP